MTQPRINVRRRLQLAVATTLQRYVPFLAPSRTEHHDSGTQGLLDGSNFKFGGPSGLFVVSDVQTRMAPIVAPGVQWTVGCPETDKSGSAFGCPVNGLPSLDVQSTDVPDDLKKDLRRISR